MESALLPEKHYYTIGDICRITGTKAHVLRYWESKFNLLRPARRYSGHRKYTQKDIEIINRIKFLVVDKRFTLAGAKREIHRQFKKPAEVAALTETTKQAETALLLRNIKKDIEDCLEILTPAGEQRELIGLK